ncbi:hypothetical protein P175DRAFT_0314073 [Aspergillus ochraceoroseus IBT 24754]|uniref:Transmembrane protein n=1 Tax=Aspergillus ochraceoroseus IBT 24754 TaxID=1392256 RepID=A0A2T5LQD5_9EURO|nr:uncharacterized protein P175DRAFT_0314073 [Aspergillus ochraceoroseus IBT 24754]PTU18490.1 hypothetical protein P175DRAFT_0314073 [Aspergillus ochraceoroseus IBT 24754]
MHFSLSSTPPLSLDFCFFLSDLLPFFDLWGFYLRPTRQSLAFSSGFCSALILSSFIFILFFNFSLSLSLSLFSLLSSRNRFHTLSLSLSLSNRCKSGISRGIKKCLGPPPSFSQVERCESFLIR